MTIEKICIIILLTCLVFTITYSYKNICKSIDANTQALISIQQSIDNQTNLFKEN